MAAPNTNQNAIVETTPDGCTVGSELLLVVARPAGLERPIGPTDCIALRTTPAMTRATMYPMSRITSAPTSFGNHAKNSSLACCKL
jgi:hypothetical protein